MACNEYSYKVTLAACPEQIYVRTSLPPMTNYLWAITTKFGKVVMREAATDLEGTITIPTNVFIDGTFNEYAGSFELYILDTDRQPLKLTFKGLEYNAVTMDFVKVDSTLALFKNVIE